MTLPFASVSLSRDRAHPQVSLPAWRPPRRNVSRLSHSSAWAPLAVGLMLVLNPLLSGLRAAVAQPPAADEAWLALIRIAPVVEKERSRPEPGRDAARASGHWAARRADNPSRQLQAQKERKDLRDAAAKARDFHTRFPSDARAAAARKIEAVAALHAAPRDNSTEARAAIRTAQDFRADVRNPVADRLQVALIMERRAEPHDVGRRRPLYNATAAERTAERMRREFGDIPEVFALYGEIVDRAEFRTADRLARVVLAAGNIPEQQRERARAAMARENLRGKPLHLSVRTTSGGVIDLGQGAAQPTVVYISRSDEPFERDDRAGAVRWIHVSLGEPEPRRSGVHDTVLRTIEPAGLDGRIARMLKVPLTPYAYVIDTNGTVIGGGPAESVTGILATLNPRG